MQQIIMATAEERDLEAFLEACKLLQANDSESESSGDSDDGEEVELSSSAWSSALLNEVAIASYCRRFQMMSQ